MNVKLLLMSFLLLSPLAGCTSQSGPESTSTPTVTETECTLYHETLDSDDNIESIDGDYNYDSLSTEAKYVVKRSIEDGSFTTTNQSRKADEFAYHDVAREYKIYRNGSTYIITTYSPCSSR